MFATFLHGTQWTPPLKIPFCKRFYSSSVARLRGVRFRLRVGEGSPEVGEKSEVIRNFTQSDFYKKFLQGTVYLFNLAVVDAAYSGDWSRIQVISHETEISLQYVCLCGLIIHGMSSLGTATLNVTRNKPWIVPSLMTFGIGVLNLIQQIYEEEETSSLQITPTIAIAALLGVSVLGEAISHAL